MDPNFSLSIMTKPRRIVQQYHILESKFWEPITSTTQDGMADGDNAAVWICMQNPKRRKTKTTSMLYACLHLVITSSLFNSYAILNACNPSISCVCVYLICNYIWQPSLSVLSSTCDLVLGMWEWAGFFAKVGKQNAAACTWIETINSIKLIYYEHSP